MINVGKFTFLTFLIALQNLYHQNQQEYLVTWKVVPVWLSVANIQVLGLLLGFFRFDSSFAMLFFQCPIHCLFPLKKQSMIYLLVKQVNNTFDWIVYVPFTASIVENQDKIWWKIPWLIPMPSWPLDWIPFPYGNGTLNAWVLTSKQIRMKSFMWFSMLSKRNCIEKVCEESFLYARLFESRWRCVGVASYSPRRFFWAERLCNTITGQIFWQQIYL